MATFVVTFKKLFFWCIEETDGMSS